MIKKILDFFIGFIKYIFKEFIPFSLLKLLQCFLVILLLLFILLGEPDPISNLHGVFLVICWGAIFAIIMYLLIQIGKEI